MVPHHTTTPAQACLASEIGRDRAFSGWYDRIMQEPAANPDLNHCLSQLGATGWVQLDLAVLGSEGEVTPSDSAIAKGYHLSR